VVVVGGAAITKSTVRHWMTALSLSDARKRSLRHDEAPREQALSVLITSHWMIDEARRQGLGMTRRDVDRRLAEQEGAYTTRGEFTELLRETGRTVADLRFELEAELAFTALQQMLAREEPERGRDARKAFLARWTSRWKARTDCRVGYIVDSCRQHAGPVAIEYPVSVDL
jgi:hypothetical protein